MGPTSTELSLSQKSAGVLRCTLWRLWEGSREDAASRYGSRADVAVAIGSPSEIRGRVRGRVGYGGLVRAWGGDRRGGAWGASIPPSRIAGCVAVRLHERGALVSEAEGGLPGRGPAYKPPCAPTQKPPYMDAEASHSLKRKRVPHMGSWMEGRPLCEAAASPLGRQSSLRADHFIFPFLLQTQHPRERLERFPLGSQSPAIPPYRLFHPRP